MHSAEDAASYVGKKADDGVHAVGSSLKSFGDTVRHQAPGRDMLKDGMSPSPTRWKTRASIWKKGASPASPRT